MSTPASVYRCAGCGHGKHLMAWAPANVYGPVGADGELAEHQSVWDDGLHEDSIQCSEHPGAVIEKFVDGQWCHWWTCPKCGGSGEIVTNEFWGTAVPCSAQETPRGIRTGQDNGHRGWRPAPALADAQGGYS